MHQKMGCRSIACIPTNGFSGARVALFTRDLGKARMALRRKIDGLINRRTGAPPGLSRGRSGDEWTNKGESGAIAFSKRLFRRFIVGQRHISDLARLNYAMMRRMMVNIRRQATRSGLPCVPVILENHTKDITDFTDIEKFVADVAHSPDVKTVTLTEIADGLRNGTFKARTA